MITFSLLGNHGRLGNQMFQYSLLRSVSIKNNFVFAIPKQHHQLFDCFDLKCKVYDLEKYSNIIDKLSVYKESKFDYDDSVFKCNDNTNFVGNFQTEKYFADIKDQIINEFKFKQDILEKSKNILKRIKNTKEVVSLHVRRGDYVNIPDLHPTCEIEYYNNSLKYFENCDIICVSDDIDWCKQNFSNTNNIYFSDSNDPYVDLCLMSICDHNIIANSSFSWWGAWLNQNKNKKVIAPSKWFGAKNSHLNTKDLYCNDWIII